MEDNFKKVPQPKSPSVALVFVLTALLSVTSLAVAAQTKQQADDLYAKEHYAEAAQIYESIIREQGVSTEIYYNLGNCYYKLDSVALSILNYERALMLDPSDGDTKANIALARGKTTDKVTPPSEMFFVTWWRSLTNIMSINSWLIIAFVAFVLMLASILVYAFMSNLSVRKAGFYGFLFMLFVTVVANLCALSQHHAIVNRHYAIIMSPAVTVKSSPSDTSTDLFIIHEGAKVEMLDQSMKEWCEVKLEEGKVGWVPVSVFEQI